MSRIETTWRFLNGEQLVSMVRTLSSTSGVYEIRITADGSGPALTFRHEEGLDLRSLELPNEPALWRQRVMDLQLRPYTAKSLLECVVFGWQAFRERQRWATHLCVWDREDFYREMFANAPWSDIPLYFDEVYGMELVELGASSGESTLPKGRVVMAGGRRFRGTVDDADYGLILERSG